MNSRINFAILFVVLSYTCNLSYTNAQFRIRNGEDIGIRQSPHSTAIFNEESYICVGSLVRMNLVVTVAHCVLKPKQKSLRVLAGTHDLYDLHLRIGQRRRVVYIYKGGFDVQTGLMDIAVLKVNKAFSGNNNVRSISLYEGELTQGLKIKVRGWGSLTAFGNDPSHLLQTTELTIVETGHCRNLYLSIPNGGILPETIICAGSDESGVAYGDSGAAALYSEQLCAVVLDSGSAYGGLPDLLIDVTNVKVRNVILYAIQDCLA